MTSVDIARPAQDSAVTAMKNNPHQTSGPSTPTQTLAEPGSEAEKSDRGTTTVHNVRTVTSFQFTMVLFAIYSTALLYGLDTTIVADIQGTVIETFGQVGKLSWIGAGFPLGSIAVILMVGKAYGIFNIKLLYIFSVTIFEAGSALCGAAPTMDALIVGRVIAGAGGAGIYLGGLNIVSYITTSTERPLYMAGLGVAWGVGTILGPVVGGAFSDSPATWRWAFYINLVIAAICVPIYLWALPSMNPKPDQKLAAKITQMDWVGSLLNAGIYATWVMGLTFGGAQWAWSDGRTVAVFVVCGVLIIAFALQQRFLLLTSLDQRIFPAGFLLSRSLLLQYLNNACMATSLFIPVYYIPIFFQFTRNDTALDAAVRLLPFIVVTIVMIMVNGALMPKFGYYMPWSLASGVFVLIGGALMFTVDSTTSPGKVYGFSVLIALGTGMSSQAAYSVVPVKVATDARYGSGMVPDAIGFVNMAQIGSIVHALAISGTVYQNLAFQYLSTALAGRGYTVLQLQGAVAGTQSEILLHASDEVSSLAVKSLVEAIDRVYILVIVAGALTLISSCFMKREKLFMEMSAGGA